MWMMVWIYKVDVVQIAGVGKDCVACVHISLSSKEIYSTNTNIYTNLLELLHIHLYIKYIVVLY